MCEGTQTQARAPTSVNACTPAPCPRARRGLGSLACIAHCARDSKGAELTDDLHSSPQLPGRVAPPSPVFLNDSEAAQYVWLGLLPALSYPVGGKKERKERKRKIKFQFPSIALGLCNQLSSCCCHCRTASVLRAPVRSSGSEPLDRGN